MSWVLGKERSIKLWTSGDSGRTSDLPLFTMPIQLVCSYSTLRALAFSLLDLLCAFVA